VFRGWNWVFVYTLEYSNNGLRKNIIDEKYYVVEFPLILALSESTHLQPVKVQGLSGRFLGKAGCPVSLKRNSKNMWQK
jgi:hypothetical protein